MTKKHFLVKKSKKIILYKMSVNTNTILGEIASGTDCFLVGRHTAGANVIYTVFVTNPGLCRSTGLDGKILTSIEWVSVGHAVREDSSQTMRNQSR